jgi:hypothetical protein
MYSTDRHTEDFVYLTQKQESGAYRSIFVLLGCLSGLGTKVSRHVTRDQHRKVILYYVRIV